jgi:hypothetical protein
MYKSFGFSAFLARWLAAMGLVVTTFNPSGYSYFDWIADTADDHWVLKALVGVVLGITYATFGLATLRSLGRGGIIAWVLFFALVIWLMVDSGMMGRVTPGLLVTLGLVIFANVFAVGVSWSYLRLRLSGQSDTNNITLR